MANSQRRMVYMKIWTSEQFGGLSDKAKILYIGMVTLADDDGRLRGNPAYLRGQIFPYNEDLSVTDVLQFRNEVEKSGLITTYSIDGFEYIEHPKWEEYQVIRKDLYKKSTLPSSNVNVTKPLRKSTLSKVKLSKDNIADKSAHQSIIKWYSDLVFSNDGFRPEIVGKDGALLKQRISKYGEENVKKLIYKFLLNDSEKFGVSISTALSSNFINKYLREIK